MEDNRVFADVFNHLIYDGEQVIDPQKLHPLDSAVIGVPYGADGAGIPVQKFRDGLKYLTAMEDETAAYLLLGLENQSEIHYAQPVKNMVYDALQYAAQVEKAAKSHRETSKAAKKRKEEEEQAKEPIGSVQDEKKPNAGEYLAGFYKEDRLIPVITLVVYFGPDEWDGPVKLHDMLSVRNKKILSFVPDYSINLIAPARLTDEEIDRFITNLREVMLFIKYSKDKARLSELVANDDGFKAVDRKAARLINVVTGSKLKFDESEMMIDMCKAISEMRMEERTEGIELGRQEGIELGKQEGIELGELKKAKETALNLYAIGMGAEKIAEVVNVRISLVKEWLERV